MKIACLGVEHEPTSHPSALLLDGIIEFHSHRWMKISTNPFQRLNAFRRSVTAVHSSIHWPMNAFTKVPSLLVYFSVTIYIRIWTRDPKNSVTHTFDRRFLCLFSIAKNKLFSEEFSATRQHDGKREIPPCTPPIRERNSNC